MKRSGKLSVALHVLVHLAESPGRPATSGWLAACVHTNPVVVRRTMSGLREAGLVASARGHGGGWSLAREARAVSLRDVYAALGEDVPSAIGKTPESPGCPIEHAVSGALDGCFRRAQALLADHLGTITLADVAADFRHLTAPGNRVRATPPIGP